MGRSSRYMRCTYIERDRESYCVDARARPNRLADREFLARASGERVRCASKANYEDDCGVIARE